MTLKDVMAELEKHGDANVRKLWLKHGIKEPFFGVKVADLKPLQKKIKKDYKLSIELFNTGNADAMYLAALVAEDDKMTKADLQKWVKMAESTNISDYAVPWVAAGSKYGMELAMEWIDSGTEHVAAAGWSTLSNLVALKPDAELDIAQLKKLLLRVEKKIHTAKNRERSKMNTFIIAVGSYVKQLSEAALDTAAKIGEVYVDVGDTSCKVPEAAVYINKVIDKGKLGVKKKEVKC